VTFEDAIAQLQAEFGAIDNTRNGFGDVREVWSGGEAVMQDGDLHPPLLCMKREHAIATWFAAARDFLVASRKPDLAMAWRIQEGPHLDKYFITMMDGKRTHRLAGERLAVTSKIAVVWFKADEPAAVP